MHENAVLFFSMILVIGLACQWLAWRINLPSILFLLACGILAGPIMKWVNPDQLLGNLFFPFVTLSVALILFEGSLTLKFFNISGLERVIRNLITIGVMLTWLLIALATHLLLHYTWEVSLLFGSLLVVTGPTVILPMLRTIRVNENIGNILQWESILIDPIGAILAVLIFAFIVSGNLAGGFTEGMIVFSRLIVVGTTLGIIGGYVFGIILRKYWIPHFLHNFAALTMVCCIFAASNSLGPDAGLLSVTVMGVWLANMKHVELSDILNFKESLSILLISILFILLAARIDFTTFVALGWPALTLFCVIQFLIRPFIVYISAFGSKLSLHERHLLAWIAPRGVVAAAMSALFGIKLQKLGYPEAVNLVPLTFIIIIGTVLLQSATARKFAKILQVAAPEAKGFLIVGANQVARAIAEQLVENQYRVCLTDEDWSSITAAKMGGLIAYWGNPVSKHAETHLDLTGINHLLLMTPHLELNILAAEHYRLDFSANNIYTIQSVPFQSEIVMDKTTFKYGGRDIFDKNTTYQDLENRLNQGAKIKTTLLTEKFSYGNYLEQDNNQRTPLFAIDPNDKIYVFTINPDFSPGVGWKIIGISQEGMDSTIPLEQRISIHHNK